MGKPFPPFDSSSSDSWGVSHLLHPSIPFSSSSTPDKSTPTPFSLFYSSSPLLEISSTLLGLSSISDLQLELFGALIQPEHHAFALAWHRDDIKPNVSKEEEIERLEAPDNGVQWNIALEDDSCLFVIPGTHKRVRNEEEIKANQMIPPEAVLVEPGVKDGFDGDWEEDPKTTLRVELKGGYISIYRKDTFTNLDEDDSLNVVAENNCLDVSPFSPPPSWSVSLLLTTHPTSSLLPSNQKEDHSSWLLWSCN